MYSSLSECNVLNIFGIPLSFVNFQCHTSIDSKYNVFSLNKKQTFISKDPTVSPSLTHYVGDCDAASKVSLSGVESTF